MSAAFFPTRRFLPLFITQFLGAFNDNAFKNALVMLIAFKTPIKDPAHTQVLITLAAALFILPYLLFSATAGQLADKYDRARIARIIKVAEIFLMVIAAVGFITHSIYFLLFVLFCMGAHSTFFGPIKYALLPQHLQDNELVAGNAYIEAGTFLSILLGTIAGGVIIMYPSGSILISIAILTIALLGYIASRFIPVAPAPMPELVVRWNIARETWNIVQHDRRNPRVFMSIIGISWFWLVGATFLSQFPTFVKMDLGSNESVVTLLLTVFSIGIGAGSIACNVLLKGAITSKYVSLAAGGIFLFSLDLFFASHGLHWYGGEDTLMSMTHFLSRGESWRILFDLFAIAVCGGMYVVPLYAIMQHESDEHHRARTIASNNVVNALFMVVAAIGTITMLKAHFSVPQVFLTVGILNALVAVYIRRLRR